MLEVQEKLSSMGYEVSEIDGVFGASTLNAIEELLSDLGRDDQEAGEEHLEKLKPIVQRSELRPHASEGCSTPDTRHPKHKLCFKDKIFDSKTEIKS